MNWKRNVIVGDDRRREAVAEADPCLLACDHAALKKSVDRLPGAIRRAIDRDGFQRGDLRSRHAFARVSRRHVWLGNILRSTRDVVRLFIPNLRAKAFEFNKNSFGQNDYMWMARIMPSSLRYALRAEWQQDSIKMQACLRNGHNLLTGRIVSVP
jgi:hypothetical protein